MTERERILVALLKRAMSLAEDGVSLLETLEDYEPERYADNSKELSDIEREFDNLMEVVR